MTSSVGTFSLRVAVPPEFRWVDPIPTFEFKIGEPKTWDLNELFVNTTPQVRPEFGLVLTSPELVGAFSVLGDALRYNGAALVLPDDYQGWLSLVAGKHDNFPGSRAIDAAGNEWILIGRQLNGEDGAAGAVMVNTGAPMGHDFLRVPAGGVPWRAWYLEFEDGVVYSLAGDGEVLLWYSHDPATFQPTLVDTD